MYSSAKTSIKLTSACVASSLIILLSLAHQCHQLNQNARNKHHHLKESRTGGASAPDELARATPTPAPEPDFEEPIGNHTVALGRDAQLSCRINNLGNFRTAWLRVEDKGILTIHTNIITRNYRVGLINKEDGKNFVLTIKNVQPSDKGGYMCQINSLPMKYAIGYLDVLTPPTFDDMPLASVALTNQAADGAAQTTTLPPATAAAQQQSTAGVVTVNEGGNATLSCRANGHPTPVITWRREDNEPILIGDPSSLSEGATKVEGPSLVLPAVSRLHSGAYLCIASNGVQPSASKRQTLDVQFSPVIRLPQTEVGVQVSRPEVRLTCFVELNPLGTYHWVKLSDSNNNGQASKTDNQMAPVGVDDLSLIEHNELINSDKFEIVMKQATSERVQMILTIRHLEKQDYAWYKCIARNTLGIQSGSIRLYELSSFSLNGMFRTGSGSDGQVDSTGGSSEQQQNDQQQQDSPSGGRERSSSGKPGGSGAPILAQRAHTRSSWIQRASNSANRNPSTDPGAPTNALLDSAPGSAAPATRFSNLASNKLLLLSHHPLLLLTCLLTLAPVAQFVVSTHRLTRSSLST